MQASTATNYAAYLQQYPLEGIKIQIGYDPIFYINNFWKIKDEKLGIIPFALWKMQRWFLTTVHENDATIIYKARQEGITWCAVAYASWLMRQGNKTVLAISQNQEYSVDILSRLRIGEDELPDWLRPKVSDPDNTRHRKYANGSEFISLPAGKDAGRGRTSALTILDEFASAQYDEEIFSAIMPQARKIIIISTAKGQGNKFHKLWTGTNNFKKLFFSWKDRPDRDQSWLERERQNYSPAIFAQEFPSNPDEGFIQTGRPVFAAEDVRKQAVNICEPIQAMNEIKIFRQPKQGEVILLGGDTASGSGADYSVKQAYAYTTDSIEQVAELRGQFPPDIFALKIKELYEYLKTCGCTVNNPSIEYEKYGATAIFELEKIHGIKVWKTDKGKYWETDSITKPRMINDMEELIRKGKLIIHSETLYNELFVYNYDDKGSTNAATSYNDDCIISTGIALQSRFGIRPRFTASELEAFYGTNRDRAEDDAPINDMAEIEGVFV